MVTGLALAQVMRCTRKGSSTCSGSTSCCRGSAGGSSRLGSPCGVRVTCAASTVPSRSWRRSSGASCQAMRASRTSTASVGLLQRSQPMRPPARSEPLTSPACRLWPSGRYCATRASVAARDVLVPAHHHSAPSSASSTTSSAAR